MKITNLELKPTRDNCKGGVRKWDKKTGTCKEQTESGLKVLNPYVLKPSATSANCKGEKMQWKNNTCYSTVQFRFVPQLKKNLEETRDEKKNG